MLTFGVNVAVIHSGQILLVKREDFDVWCLPGGHIDAGESVAQAALRETREETGIEVKLTRLVGVYSVQGGNAGGNHVILFRAEPLGGELRPQESEVVELAYFDPDQLPEPLVWWHRQRIKDALSDVGGSVAWSQQVAWPFAPDVSRESIYDLRDRSTLSRQEFYLRYFDQNDKGDEILEVRSGWKR